MEDAGSVRSRWRFAGHAAWIAIFGLKPLELETLFYFFFLAERGYVGGLAEWFSAAVVPDEIRAAPRRAAGGNQRGEQG